MFLSEFIEIIGSSVCHQLPSRTLLMGDIFLPTCARCSGIYIGFFISAILMFLIFRKKESNLPPTYVLVLLALFILSTIIDGALSYLSSYTTNNLIRLLTGFLCGSSIMVIVFPIFNFEYYRHSGDERVFRRPWKFLLFLLVTSIFIVLLLLDLSFLGWVFYYLNFIAIIFTFYFINTVLLLLFPSFSRKAGKLFSKHLVFPSLIAISLTALELFISYRLHQFLNKL